MKRSKFFNQSLILIISNLTTGVFAFIFSIILSKKLGAEGMGLYGIIMPIYDLFICLINGGMVAAISKSSAIYIGKNDYSNLHKTIESTITFEIIWAIVIVCLVFINAPFISSKIIKDGRSIQALRVMCPAMLFIALSAILKGYFYGVSKAKTAAVIDILEKGFRIVIFMCIVNFLNISSVKNTVTAAYTTLTFGELISFIFLYLVYLKHKRHHLYTYNYNNRKSEDGLQLLFDVLVVSVPLCLNGFLTTALSTVSTLITPRRLVDIGFTHKTALSMIGRFSSMAISIPLFPLVIVTSICTILIPNLSENLSKKNYFLMEHRITKVIKISILLGLSSLIICNTIPSELGFMFFKRKDLGNYIRFLSFIVPFIYISVLSYCVLNGIGKQKILLKNSIITAIEEVILLYVLTGIPFINIYGCGLTILITCLTSIILNFKEIKKICFVKIIDYENFIYLLCSVLGFFILNIVSKFINFKLAFINNIIIILCGFLIMFSLAKILGKKEPTNIYYTK
ncbi:stage V sporulation protein B [Clostridium oceanicum]|uniref:Multidrug-efflux transporter n=1 Tax=Clostridium oceanicum TaxID=1543 RepID=A0ABN1JHK8_9CLOT